MKKQYVIKHQERGVYFKGPTPIGPAFGELEDAIKMTRRQAEATIALSWKFSGCVAVAEEKR